MNTIVVGYDDSEPSRRALERAVTFSRAFDAKLVVTSVAPVNPPAAARSIGTDPVDTSQQHLAELAAAREYLTGEGIEAEYVEAFGHPGESIVAAAQEHDADMIMVGTRETGILQRLLGASVSDAVSHRAHCDVLIVHPSRR
jgi:nucleotide-binding universal stress UspA family protein